MRNRVIVRGIGRGRRGFILPGSLEGVEPKGEGRRTGKVNDAQMSSSDALVNTL